MGNLGDKNVNSTLEKVIVTGGKEFRSYNNIARADMAAFLHRMKDKGLVSVQAI